MTHQIQCCVVASAAHELGWSHFVLQDQIRNGSLTIKNFFAKFSLLLLLPPTSSVRSIQRIHESLRLFNAISGNLEKASTTTKKLRLLIGPANSTWSRGDHGLVVTGHGETLPNHILNFVVNIWPVNVPIVFIRKFPGSAVHNCLRTAACRTVRMTTLSPARPGSA